jgi:hypothetical protein
MHLKQARAECQGCSQTWVAPNAMGLASQHHERTGHPVEVHVIYKSDNSGKGADLRSPAKSKVETR